MGSSQPTIDWQQALSEHRRWLATVLRARGVEVGALDEVLQEVHFAAVKHADRLRDPQKLAPWLYRVAVTCALQHRRRLGRGRRLIERYAAEHADQLSETEPDPLDWLLADEQRRIVRTAVKTLPARDAELLLLKYTEDWSYRQLAEHLGVTVSTVEARLHRARHKMRQALSQLAPEIVPQ
jgi:RNA polymerase sigma-70 factor (ECF subfamily)